MSDKRKCIIGVEGDAITIAYDGDFEGRQVLDNNRDAMYAIEMTSEDTVYVSSSVHFPYEQTSEQWIIDLCKLLSAVQW